MQQIVIRAQPLPESLTQDIAGRLRQQPIHLFARRQALPDAGSAGDIALPHRFIMITGSDTRNGQRPDGTAGRPQGAQVFDAKDIIGLCKHPASGIVTGQSGICMAAGGGKMHPLAQQGSGFVGHLHAMLVKHPGHALQVFQRP